MSAKQDPRHRVGEGQPRVRAVGEPQQVPVFNCRVYVSGPDQRQQFTARAAALEGLVAHGDSERQALAQLVAAFKRQAAEWLERGEPIPWLDPVPPPRPDETERYLAVHL